MKNYHMHSSVTVLHVEDSISDALYVKGVLEHIRSMEFVLKQAANLVDALQILETDPSIDVVLLDLLLPDSEGISTLRVILEAAPDKAVIMLTGEDNQELVLQGLHNGAQDYIAKTDIKPELIKRTILAAHDRQKAQQELRMSKERFQLVVTGTFDGIWDWMIADDKFWLSDQFYALLGYEPGEFPATLPDWKNCFHPDDRGALWRNIERHLDDQSMAYHAEHRMRTKDGEDRWFLIRGQAVWDKNGEPIRMAGSISDIHDRKRMETELTESEERYFLAVRGAGVGIWDWDIQTGELYWSEKYKRMLGVTFNEFVPKFTFFEERLHPEDREKTMQAIKDHLEDQEKYETEYRLRHNDGHYIWIKARGQAIWNDDNVATRMAGSVADMTEYKKATDDRTHMEVQLRHSQKLEAIGQLAAGIAHEINTPSQFVGDNTRFFQDAFADVSELLALYEMLLQAVEKGEPAGKLLEEIKDKIDEVDLEYLLDEIPQATQQSLDGVNRIRDIVKAMKEFSHPGSANKELSDLNQNIQNTATVSRNEWKYYAELETDLDESLPQVECLPNELNQVILNMIVNAAHAIADVQGDSGNLGKITITTRAVDDECEITIADTGAGMPKEVQQRVFDPFFTTKEVGKGTGQGLAIAYSVVVDKHQGNVKVESEVGQGTKFIIRIPIRAESSQAQDGEQDEAIAVCR